jgi:hypothetical protein
MPYQTEGRHFLMIVNDLCDFVIALARSWPDSGGPVKFNTPTGTVAVVV